MAAESNARELATKITEKADGADESTGTSTFFQAFANTFRSIFGTGILAMPYAFAAAGLYPAILATCCIGFWTAYTFRLIAQCVQKARPSCKTYDDLMEDAFGALGRWFAIFNLLLHQELVCCAYLVFSATNYWAVIAGSTAGHPYSWWAIGLLFPLFYALTCLRDMSSLSVVSQTGNFFVLLSLAIILGVAWPKIDWSMWSAPIVWDMSGVSTFFGIAAFAFAGQSEVVPVFLSMKNRSEYGQILVYLGTFTLLLYAAVASLVFCAYGSGTNANVFQNMDGIAANLAKFCMSTVIYTTLPLKLVPAYSAIEAIVVGTDDSSQVASGSPASLFVSDPRQLSIRFVLAVIPALAAMVCENFGFLVELIGALSIGLIGFAMPPMMYLVFSARASGSNSEGGSLVDTVVNVVFVVMGAGITLFSTVKVVGKEFGWM